MNPIWSRVGSRVAIALAATIVLTVPAYAGRRRDLACRHRLASNVSDMVHATLRTVDGCQERRVAGTFGGNCNDLTSIQNDSVGQRYTRGFARASAVIAAICGGANDLLGPTGNYKGVTDADGLARALLTAVRKAIETNAVAVQGLTTLPGKENAAARACHRAIGQARSAIVRGIVDSATSCQRRKDKRSSTLSEIDPECLAAVPAKSVAKARATIARKCGGFTGPDVGSCSPLPDCVIAAATTTAKSIASDIYGATPEQQRLLCGDGLLEFGEGCDDGNKVDTDDCTNDCQPATCGDGITWAGHEECDDGNSDDTDACTTECKAARCGDGIVEQGVEECDDGNDVPNDGCTDCMKDAAVCDANNSLAVTLVLSANNGTPDLQGVTVELAYAPPIAFPGLGPAPEERIVDLVGGGLKSTNNEDTNGDNVGDTFRYAYAELSGVFPFGPLVTITFDCPAGTRVRPSQFACSIPCHPNPLPPHDQLCEASDSSGNEVDPTAAPLCEVSLPRPAGASLVGPIR